MQRNRDAVEPPSHGTENGSAKNVVIIFAKVPVAGTVKTRLIRDASLNAEGAAVLAEAMLKDTLALAADSNASEILVGFTPADERESVERIVRDVAKE
ncbi:MAG: hypothetical protein ACXV5N_09690, partial [Halobacteriota archaeon]